MSRHRRDAITQLTVLTVGRLVYPVRPVTGRVTGCSLNSAQRSGHTLILYGEWRRTRVAHGAAVGSIWNVFNAEIVDGRGAMRF